MTPAQNTNPEDNLGQTLARQADRFVERGGSPLELDQVLARAGEIRRGRRMRATIAMAAVVLAVAVPVGISAIGTDPTKDAKPPVATSSPTELPTKGDNSPIKLSGLQSGTAPRTGYFLDGKLLYQGASVPLAGVAPSGVFRMSGGFLVTQLPDGADNLVATFVNDDGSPSPRTWPTTGSVATSADGAVSALAQPDGTITWVEAGASRYGDLGKIPGSGPFDVDAVVGDDCSGRAEGDGCVVYVHSSGQSRGAWSVNAHGVVTALPSGITKVVGVGVGGVYLVETSATDNQTCSQARDSGPEGKVLWNDCEFSYLSFSPDGRYLLAASPSDGSGPRDLAIVDAKTGRTALHLQSDTDNFLTELAWEDGTHVLASVYDHGKFAVVRFSLNGTRERATKTVPDPNDSYVSPIKLG